MGTKRNELKEWIRKASYLQNDKLELLAKNNELTKELDLLNTKINFIKNFVELLKFKVELDGDTIPSGLKEGLDEFFDLTTIFKNNANVKEVK